MGARGWGLGHSHAPTHPLPSPPRSLGVHCSKVRSLTLDSWEPELLKVCVCGGAASYQMQGVGGRRWVGKLGVGGSREPGLMPTQPSPAS